MEGGDTECTIRALSDPHRRRILDALRERDGQSVGELGQVVPALGRHAVLKHVRVLEEAGLISSAKDGRRRVVHLNPVPIVLLARRWLDDYSALAGMTLARLKTHLESERPMLDTRPAADPSDAREEVGGGALTRTVRAAIVIEAEASEVWHALTDPERSRQWYFGTSIRSTFEVGSPLDYVDDAGAVQIRGTVRAVEQGRLLVHTFNATWSPEVAGDDESLYTWRLTPENGNTHVSIEHAGVPMESQTSEEVEAGAVFLLSALKTLLETGRPLQRGRS